MNLLSYLILFIVLALIAPYVRVSYTASPLSAEAKEALEARSNYLVGSRCVYCGCSQVNKNADFIKSITDDPKYQAVITVNTKQSGRD